MGMILREKSRSFRARPAEQVEQGRDVAPDFPKRGPKPLDHRLVDACGNRRPRFTITASVNRMRRRSSGILTVFRNAETIN